MANDQSNEMVATQIRGGMLRLLEKVLRIEDLDKIVDELGYHHNSYHNNGSKD
jgi:hypothetical protein